MSNIYASQLRKNLVISTYLPTETCRHVHKLYQQTSPKSEKPDYLCGKIYIKSLN